MKALHLLLFFVFLAGLGSCMWGMKDKKTIPGTTKDTLVYTYETIKQRADDCRNKTDSNCTVAEIKYPVFKDEQLLNNLIVSRITGSKDNSITINAMISDFLKSYDASKKDTAGLSVPFELNENIIVLRQDSSLVTLQAEGSEFTGGTHGSDYISFINWNAKANKNVVLSDILNKDYIESLTKAGETIFRKNEKLSANASLADDYFFKDAKFALPNNFSLTPLGIRFLYNNYEIKPYAAGKTDLLIPYAQIKNLLQPNSIVRQYFK